MTTDPDLPPARPASSWLVSALISLGPLVVLVVIGSINALGDWPAFRQQDTSILHWILTNHSAVLRGLSQERNSEGSDSLNAGINPPRDFLTLENMNLSGLDLTSSDFADMSIENVNFSGTRLVNANFSCADLTHVNFSGAQLMNSRFDYSTCQDPTSTARLQCGKMDRDEVARTRWPDNKALRAVICIEGRFVGTDFSKSQIRGDIRGIHPPSGAHAPGKPQSPCKQLLVLVGDMSGASFDNARLTCVALIHRPVTPRPVSVPFPWWPGWSKDSGRPSRTPAAKSTMETKGGQGGAGQTTIFSFNGISFVGARLDRVALLKGSFRFSQFERADLSELVLNLNADKADLNYSMFNEIQCKLPAGNPTARSPETALFRPCLLVPQGTPERNRPLRLNFLWSTLVTNLQPSKQDRFLCTPGQDLPARVEGRLFEAAPYWLSKTREPTPRPTLLDCPGDAHNPNGSKRPPPPPSHLLLPPPSAN